MDDHDFRFFIFFSDATRPKMHLKKAEMLSDAQESASFFLFVFMKRDHQISTKKTNTKQLQKTNTKQL